MKRFSFFPLVALTVSAAFFFSEARLNSQGIAPAKKTPVELLHALKASNAELLKKQEASLKKLDDLKTQAEQLRIFSKRA